MRTILTAAALALLIGSFAIGDASAADGGADAPKVKPYPLTTCIVSGDALGGDMGEPIVKVYGDREIKFCCKDCIKQFEADQAAFVKKIDEAAAKAPAPAPKAAADSHHH